MNAVGGMARFAKTIDSPRESGVLFAYGPRSQALGTIAFEFMLATLYALISLLSVNDARSSVGR